MDEPRPPAKWLPVRTSDQRWFHADDLSEIRFATNGDVTFLVQGRHLRMGEVTLTGEELAWIGDYRDWLLTQ